MYDLIWVLMIITVAILATTIIGYFKYRTDLAFLNEIVSSAIRGNRDKIADITARLVSERIDSKINIEAIQRDYILSKLMIELQCSEVDKNE